MEMCKLFIAPRGAATRVHQDNHHAHAWLSQARGELEPPRALPARGDAPSSPSAPTPTRLSLSLSLR